MLKLHRSESKAPHSAFAATRHTSTHSWLSLAAKVTIIVQGIVCIISMVSGYFVPYLPLKMMADNNRVYSANGHKCRASLPRLGATGGAISPTDPIFRRASSSLDDFLRSRVTAHSDIDSLAVAVVTPSGVVFQKGYGVLKANESDAEKQGSVDERSIYRIASITKMFNALETLILRDKGALNLDDPVTRFLPNFSYNPASWPEYLSSSNGTSIKKPLDPITIRQLASHMSGIGREYPPVEIGNFIHAHSGPKTKGSSMPPPEIKVPTRNEIIEGLKAQPLIIPPYSYPIYSNTGFDLLGWVNIEANAAFGVRSQEPSTFADLLKRDIFDPLGMNSSSFTISPDMAERVAVAAQDNWDTDLDFTDALNPAGGQYSSLSDLALFMQSLLDPHRKSAVLSPYTVREWLRPLHGWSDELTEVGAPWEISKYPDAFGGRQRFFQKGGNLVSHHSHFAVNPVSSYGVVVLIAGRYSNAARISYEAIRRFQPVFDELQQTAARNAYEGEWSSRNGDDSRATIVVHEGSLWIKTLVVNGTDVLALHGAQNSGGKKSPVALWDLGPERPGEFRFAVGRSGLNDDPIAGCEPYWVTIDALRAHGVPIDLLYFTETGSDGEAVLTIAGAGVTLSRVSRSG